NNVSYDIYNELKESLDASLVKELVLDDKLEKKTIFSTVTKIEFVRPKQQEKPVRLTAITIKGKGWGGDKGGKITGKGTLKTGKLDFEDVYFVKELQFNLLSGNPQKEDQGYVNSGCSRYMTGNMSISLTSKNLMEDMLPLGEEPKEEKLLVKELLKLLADESQGLLKVLRKNNMYSVDIKNIFPKESLTYLVAKATLDESMLSYRRLGHVYFKTINKLFKENLVRGLPTKCFENDQTCVACLKGKKHKASCKSKIKNSITQPLFMFHIDLFGLTFMRSLMNKKYCLVVIDDYSRFTWVFFLTTKDETSGILKSFITEIENLVDKKVKIIRCDNGTEFKNKVMSEFCEKKGIKKEFSVARTPQQNGVAERRNRTLIEAARTMLAYSKLPTTFWAEADNTACYDLYSSGSGNTLHWQWELILPVGTLSWQWECLVHFIPNSDGPEWLFNIDALTKSMNYVPVVADDSLFDSSSKNANNDKPQPFSDAGKKNDDGVAKESEINDQQRLENSTQDVNTGGPSINTVSTNVNTCSLNINIVSPSVTIALLEATHADLFGD
nr:hypothetical protein [Tanacetum cinerariifolium]